MELWRVWWVVDVASGAARMVLWAALLGLVAARLLRGAPGDRVARVAWGALAVQGVTLLLGRVGPLDVAVLLTAVLAIELRLRADDRSRWENAWLSVIDLFHDPGRGALEHSSSRHAVSVRHTLALVLRALRVVARRAMGLALLRGRVGASRLRRFATLVTAGAAAVVVAILRSQRDFPLGPDDVALLLARAGHARAAGHGLTALAEVELAGRLSGASPAVAATAFAAPIVAVAAWSGVGILRRLAPRAPFWWGALAGGIVPTFAILLGHAVTPDLALGVLLPWSLLGPDARGRGAWRPLAVAAALALIHPGGALLGMLGALLAFVARRASGSSPRAGVRLTAALVAVSFTAVIVACSRDSVALGAWLRRGAVAPALLLGVWLAARRGWDTRGRAARGGRSLGTLLVMTATLEHALRWTASELPVATLPALVTIACAVVAEDLLREPGRRESRSGEAAFSLATMLILVSWVALPVARRGGLPRDAAEVAQALRARHLPGTYQVLGPVAARPAFVGVAPYSDCEQVAPRRFLDLAPPTGRGPGVTRRYVLLGRGQGAQCPWADEVLRAGVPLASVGLEGDELTARLLGVDVAAAERVRRAWSRRLIRASSR